MDSYYPTLHLRLKMDHEYPDDETRRVTFRLQQLWVSPWVGDESEWRDLRIVDADGHDVSHITGPLLYGRTL